MGWGVATHGGLKPRSQSYPQRGAEAPLFHGAAGICVRDLSANARPSGAKALSMGGAVNAALKRCSTQKRCTPKGCSAQQQPGRRPAASLRAGS